MRDPCRTRAATALCISVASRRGHACHFKPVYLQRTLNGLCQLKGAIHLTPPPSPPISHLQVPPDGPVRRGGGRSHHAAVSPPVQHACHAQCAGQQQLSPPLSLSLSLSLSVCVCVCAHARGRARVSSMLHLGKFGRRAVSWHHACMTCTLDGLRATGRTTREWRATRR